MDGVNPNPYFNNHRLYSFPQQAAPPPSAEAPSKAPAPTEKIETFSSLFEDTELERLQKNLESIAALAEEALQRFENPEQN